VLRSITTVNISQIDLNLLHVLHAVLAEGSATRAAKRLHVTQSAVSNALSRLRQVLGDPLVVRSSRGLVATPRAAELGPELSRIMQSLQTLLAEPEAFEAGSSRRVFTLAAGGYCAGICGAGLAARLGEQAPNASLRWLPLEHLAAGEGLAAEIDAHVGMPPRVPAGCHARALLEDSFTCMVPGSTSAPSRMGLAAYLAARHVRVSVLGSTRDPIDELLAKRRLSRNVVLSVSHFAAVPEIVERTGCVATLSRRLAQVQARRFRVALCEPPLSLGRRPMRLIWHERTHTDPGARFFRELVRSAALASASP